MKTLWINVVHDDQFPWEYDRNVVTYSVATLVDGEPDYAGGISDERLNIVITDATTRGEIRAACVADATTKGFLP
jgi:hypothetical protein